ncbi:MAG: MarR family winged helix-turn-helix transcriptional regulator [Christensenellales bacterium]
MDAFASALNDLLVNTFHSILSVEEASLRRISASRLSINELHLLEVVKKGGPEGCSISDIAKELAITLPSVTTAVNKLARKDFVTKTKAEGDRRLVIVQLTRQGVRAEAAHRYFHRHMVLSVSQGLAPDEREALLRGLEKLQGFFRDQEGLLPALPGTGAEIPGEAKP